MIIDGIAHFCISRKDGGVYSCRHFTLGEREGGWTRPHKFLSGGLLGGRMERGLFGYPRPSAPLGRSRTTEDFPWAHSLPPFSSSFFSALSRRWRLGRKRRRKSKEEKEEIATGGRTFEFGSRFSLLPSLIQLTYGPNEGGPAKE